MVLPVMSTAEEAEATGESGMNRPFRRPQIKADTWSEWKCFSTQRWVLCSSKKKSGRAREAPQKFLPQCGADTMYSLRQKICTCLYAFHTIFKRILMSTCELSVSVQPRFQRVDFILPVCSVLRSVIQSLTLTFQPKGHHIDICNQRCTRKCVSVGLLLGSV